MNFVDGILVSYEHFLFSPQYLFICLRQVLVADLWSSIFVVACGIFSCYMQILSCRMWDLVPWPGIEPKPPALGAWSLSPWTTREVPLWAFLSAIVRSDWLTYIQTRHLVSPPLLCFFNWSKLREIVKDREAWHAAVHGSQRVGHDWVTEQQQLKYSWFTVLC